MSFTGSATCGCGQTYTSTEATQARADSIAQQMARTCAGNDRQRKVYEAAAKRRADELAGRQAEARRRAEERRRKT